MKEKFHTLTQFCSWEAPLSMHLATHPIATNFTKMQSKPPIAPHGVRYFREEGEGHRPGLKACRARLIERRGTLLETTNRMARGSGARRVWPKRRKNMMNDINLCRGLSDWPSSFVPCDVVNGAKRRPPGPGLPATKCSRLTQHLNSQAPSCTWARPAPKKGCVVPGSSKHQQFPNKKMICS